MSNLIYKKLSSQSITYESHLDYEQRLALMLHKFSKYIAHKTKEQLMDIRLQIQGQAEQYYLDKETVRLCLHMLYIVNKQLSRLEGQ